ncbi:hypothetical protein [Achromobacter xylosoxidans]|uniref:hypothetical protein n=1 Tax=Alcaligenes xylosoxydans xylosoxydans TaxID=85698 RepID=UPI0013012952|nr:hypothetical protein [Achromobacter xylosoxidans]MCH4573831.1 hypothetical protein [Achromobacter xylosoxidans]MDD7987754.1 hypothetical protein [Achromobacter xylosoxidans]NEV03938.1 hypothetical protein [Achromobacter xylosoxidans]
MVLLADVAAEVGNFDQFFNAADEKSDHGSLVGSGRQIKWQMIMGYFGIDGEGKK